MYILKLKKNCFKNKKIIFKHNYRYDRSSDTAANEIEARQQQYNSSSLFSN